MPADVNGKVSEPKPKKLLPQTRHLTMPNPRIRLPPMRNRTYPSRLPRSHFQLGETLVVAPNGLCPMRVQPGAGVPHDRVREALERVGAAFGAAFGATSVLGATFALDAASTSSASAR